MNVLRAKRSKKIILGAVTAGVAAIGIAATLPAHADTTFTMRTTAPNPGDAADAIRNECASIGGTLTITFDGWDGSGYRAEGNCVIP